MGGVPVKLSDLLRDVEVLERRAPEDMEMCIRDRYIDAKAPTVHSGRLILCLNAKMCVLDGLM